MFSNIVNKRFAGVINRGLVSRPAFGVTSVRFNSSFDELAKAMKQPNNKKEDNNKDRNSSAISDIDNLLSSTFDFQSNSHYSNKSNDYILDNSLKHPRDVAKSIRLQGPIAGRSVDVQYGNFNRALGGIFTVVKSNKIRYLQKVQSRFIPPAKYRKQKKREWWRRKFSQGFKELMSQVRDAKRRGY